MHTLLLVQHAAVSFRPMILNHTEKSSVEERIKRNIYKIQRTTADLDKNFTKR